MANLSVSFFFSYLRVFLFLSQTAYLFSCGSVPPSAAMIRLGGPPGSGKSTLADSLTKDRASAMFRWESQADEESDDPRARTKGLRHLDWTDEKGAKFVITDMGGQDTFFLAHQAFVAYDGVPAINAIVVSSLKKEKMLEEVRSWGGFFACRARPDATKPHLLLIATRFDRASPEDVANVGEAHRLLRAEFGENFHLLELPFMIDGRKSWGDSMRNLREALHGVHGVVMDPAVS